MPFVVEGGIITRMGFDFERAVRAPFRMQPGLQRLPDDAPLLTPVGPGSRHQREKLAVLSAFPHKALCALPDIDAAPALRWLSMQAAAWHPEAWAHDHTGAQARRLGTAVDADGQVRQTAEGVFGLGDEIARCLRPLAPSWRLGALLALAFAEDMVLVQSDVGRVAWTAVALPSHWRPQDKLGLDFRAVHAPVADAQAVRGAADALVALMRGGARWSRDVWTVTPHPRLHALPEHVDAAPWSTLGTAPLPAGAWWRTEHQRLAAVPGTGLACFTIRIDTQPLEHAIDTPERARALHDALASMSDAVLQYRRLAPARDALLDWLAARAAV